MAASELSYGNDASCTMTELGRGLFHPGEKHPRNDAWHLVSKTVMNPDSGTFPVYA